jgi:UDP-N-acetylmuramoyl-L-alanyl-D-glutamate--2,6-diaminopimelate ligase
VKKLSEILYKVHITATKGTTGIDIASVQIDSRKVQSGSLFIAVKGSGVDGHLFISKAMEQGAVAIVCETLPVQQAENITYIQTTNSAEAAGIIAHNFYDQPTKKIKLVGVTGTNGKTTIATLLYKLFTCLGYDCGLISTVENQIAGKVIPATHTTPDPVSLNALLKQMADEGCTHAFMEVSSHAVHQHRIAGLEFAGAIFSNITHDHLDYHKTFDEYIKAKKAFFDRLSSSSFAVTNLDDKSCRIHLQKNFPIACAQWLISRERF